MSLSILLVDDERPSLDSLEDMLARRFRVLRAGPTRPVQEALQLWEQDASLQLAILDMRMPGGDGPKAQAGIRLLERMKQLKPAGRIAIRSAYDDHANLALAAGCGADGFIGKDWSRDALLANVNFLQVWVTLGAALAAVGRGIDFRIPRAAGHSERTRDLCRALVVHLTEADPKNFDLAACLLAAELHDLGKVALPDRVLSGQPLTLKAQAQELLEGHTAFGIHLRHLGPGFEKVERIIELHHSGYRQPRDAAQPASREAHGAPREEDIPLEAHVLHLADTLDNLLTNPPAYPPESALEILTRETEEGAFDPRVMAALRQLLGTDRPAFDGVYASISRSLERELALYFPGERTTAAQLQISLVLLSGLYLPGGRATDRLLVAGIDRVTFQDKPALRVRLTGSAEDVLAVPELLERCRAQRQPPRGAARPHLTDCVAWEPLPEGVEVLPSP